MLLVEDDRELIRQLSADLLEDRCKVQVEQSGPAALQACLEGTWDVVILDVSLPGLNGFEVLEQLRRNRVETPVIFLTARGEISDRVRGLLLGADDYLTKPFSKDELKARLHAIHRRYAVAKASGAAVPSPPRGWKLNSLLRQVTIEDMTVSLQPKEWSLLELFLSHEGQPLTKTFLLDRVWGIRFDPGTNVVDAVVCRLRSKLDQPGRPSHLRTLRGRGYVFHRDL